jgi:hypothetical protein
MTRPLTLKSIVNFYGRPWSNGGFVFLDSAMPNGVISYE